MLKVTHGIYRHGGVNSARFSNMYNASGGKAAVFLGTFLSNETHGAQEIFSWEVHSRDKNILGNGENQRL